MKTITIIGGGASGTLLAINLVRSSHGQPFEINLVERRKSIGRGVAFGTDRDAHLLNVPAGKMGAFPDDTEHFHRWLTLKGHDYEPTSFVPRRIYGDYLRASLDEELENMPPHLKFSFVGQQATDITIEGSEMSVVLQSGQALRSDTTVLAFGNFRPPHPTVEDLSFLKSEKYFQDPWDPQMYRRLDPRDSVFIVGTGLSMVDVVLHLFRQGHEGRITAISTRGLLPSVHKLGYTYSAFDDELNGLSRITDILKVVRKHISIAEDTGSDWRAVIDSLRPVTQEIWLRLPLTEKRYFMQHLSRYWNIARHRMPAEAAPVLDSMRANGRLDILKGRLKQIEVDDFCGFQITYATLGEIQTATSDVLINCIGSESNYSRVESTLVRNLMRSGRIRNDALSLGLDATPDGALIGRDGRASDRLFTLGTALKGILWETTAIPEIRVQAKKLSDLIAGE